ncbi:28S ribosomal protein S9, mitochondrial [Armadillidium nasatum]|uniref:Small ribosomal subunit protein uS9m n=1 Tax=Armadillidium nasatum TaxID=96803 RepID=A0A5N5SZ45_9CRUS|nr:28S ribosomal protein S9, mitochondrial [Armadillidium nasatum]
MHFTKGLRGLCMGLQDLRLFYAGQNITFKKVAQAGKTNYSISSRSVSQARSETELTTFEMNKHSQKAKISKAMKAYLQRSVEHDKFMETKITEYEIGKRHLANMMGEDPQTFTQDDINEALKYLMPSGLFEPKARPSMNHPLEDYQKMKEAEFDELGRPYHTLFYTGLPKFFSILQQISFKAQELDSLLYSTGNKPAESKLLSELVMQFRFAATSYLDELAILKDTVVVCNIHGSKLFTKEKLEEKLLEKISDKLYEHLCLSFERLIDHPYSATVGDFIMQYREPVTISLYAEDIPELMYNEKGVPYMTATGLRKKSKAEVTVYGQGSGKFTVNGKDILYFDSIQDREQIMFPLQYTGLLRSVDVEATAEGGGHSGQAGAIRYAISSALKSFVSPSMAEKMRIAGLLTRDARKRERKKPGQRRARAKYTWKKR